MATSGGHLSRQTHVTTKPSLANKDARTPSPRSVRRGAVTFDQQTSIYPEDGGGEQQQGLLKEAKDGEEEVEQRPARGSCYGCHFLVENKIARRLFRVCAVLNLISLVFSAPLRSCEPGMQKYCDHVFAQLVIITVLDLLLAILYTIQVYVRFQYSLYQHIKKKQVRVHAY